VEWPAARLRSQRAHPTPTPAIPSYPPARASASSLHRLVKYPHPEKCKQADGEHGHETTASTFNSGDGGALAREVRVPRGNAVLRATVEKPWGVESGGREFAIIVLPAMRITTAAELIDKLHARTHAHIHPNPLVSTHYDNGDDNQVEM
jgi:hypothetical protein